MFKKTRIILKKVDQSSLENLYSWNPENLQNMDDLGEWNSRKTCWKNSTLKFCLQISVFFFLNLDDDEVSSDFVFLSRSFLLWISKILLWISLISLWIEFRWRKKRRWWMNEEILKWKQNICRIRIPKADDDDAFCLLQLHFMNLIGSEKWVCAVECQDPPSKRIADSCTFRCFLERNEQVRKLVSFSFITVVGWLVVCWL